MTESSERTFSIVVGSVATCLSALFLTAYLIDEAALISSSTFLGRLSAKAFRFTGSPSPASHPSESASAVLGSPSQTPSGRPFAQLASNSRIALFYLRVFAALFGICHNVVYYLAFYVGNMSRKYCVTMVSIEIFMFSSFRAIMILYFTVRLMFLSKVLDYYREILAIYSTIGLGWVMSMVYLGSIQKFVGYEFGCSSESTKTGIVSYSLATGLYTIAHLIVFRKFVQIVTRNIEGSKDRVPNEGDVSKSKDRKSLAAVIFRTKISFYLYSLLSVFADVYYISVYYIFYEKITDYWWFYFVDVFYTCEIAVGIVGIIASNTKFFQFLERCLPKSHSDGHIPQGR